MEANSEFKFHDFHLGLSVCNIVLIQRGRNRIVADSPNATPARTPDHHSSHTQQPTPPQLPPCRSITHPTQPQLPQQLEGVPDPSMGHHKEVYDKLPRALPAPPIPSKAGEEGMYDIIPGHRRIYLHEKMANNDRSTPPVTWTPQLPPRSSTLKRTCSAEAVGSLVKDHDKLTRHGSERRASGSSAREDRKRSDSASVSKRSHSSTSMEGDQERRVKRERSSLDHRHRRHHHSRSSEHSSEKHRSSSEHHRSSSDKNPKSSESSGSNVWKLLTNPSKTKSSPHRSKESPSSKKESPSSKKEREGKKERDGERKHSSRGKESTPESPDYSMAQLSLSQRNQEVFPIVSHNSLSHTH